MKILVWLSMYEFMRFTYDWGRFIQPVTGMRLEHKGAMLDEYDCPVSIRMRDLDIFEMIPEEKGRERKRNEDVLDRDHIQR